MNTTEPLLELRDVSFRYTSAQVLETINLTVRAGELKALLGPNGGGKSTLLKIGLGILKPQLGEARLFSEPASRFKGWSRIGYVPQAGPRQGAQLLPFTAAEVVAMGLPRRPLGWLRGGGQGSAEAVAEALAATGVERLAKRQLQDLSTGQQQRVMVAQALVKRPRMLILDEPDASVDSAGKEHLHELLHRINAESGVAILLVSHDIGAVCARDWWCVCINCSLTYEGPSAKLSRTALAATYGHQVELLEHGT